MLRKPVTNIERTLFDRSSRGQDRGVAGALMRMAAVPPAAVTRAVAVDSPAEEAVLPYQSSIQSRGFVKVFEFATVPGARYWIWIDGLPSGRTDLANMYADGVTIHGITVHSGIGVNPERGLELWQIGGVDGSSSGVYTPTPPDPYVAASLTTMLRVPSNDLRVLESVTAYLRRRV